MARLSATRAPARADDAASLPVPRRSVWAPCRPRVAAALSIFVVLGPAVAADPGPVDAGEGVLRSLTPSLTYEGTVLSNLAGGRRTGSTAVGNLHLKWTVNAESFGHPGTAAFVDALWLHGGAPSRLVGDSQDTSNIEGPVGTVVDEAWVQHNSGDGAFSLLAGVYDLNSEFYTLQASGLFLNGSFGIGPEFAQSGVGGPSIFPRTSAGLRLAWRPTAMAVLRVTLLDGAPVVRNGGEWAVFRRGDGALGVVEWAAVTETGTGADAAAPAVDRIGRFASPVPVPYGDKLAVGFWHYTARYDDAGDLDASGRPVRRRGSSGAYAVGERQLLGRGDDGSRHHLSAFFQAGVADPRVNRFGRYFGAGLVAAAWGPMRDADQLGLAVARAVNGSHYQRAAQRQGGAAHAETTFELSYLTRLGKALTLQPDLQYVVRPNTDRALANAWVLQCRFKIEY